MKFQPYCVHFMQSCYSPYDFFSNWRDSADDNDSCIFLNNIPCWQKQHSYHTTIISIFKQICPRITLIIYWNRVNTSVAELIVWSKRWKIIILIFTPYIRTVKTAYLFYVHCFRAMLCYFSFNHIKQFKAYVKKTLLLTVHPFICRVNQLILFLFCPFNMRIRSSS